MNRIADYQALANRYRDIATKLPADAEEWHRELARDAYRDHQELLSGKTSKKELRRLRYPFAKAQVTGEKGGKGRGGRRAKGAHPSLPINEHTGRLKRNLFLQENLLIGLQSFSMGSTAPYARFIFDPRGTKKMIGRGLMTGHIFGLTTPGEIERRWRSRKRIFNDKFKSRIRKP